MANRKKLTDEQLKEIKLLQNSYAMLEKTKAEANERGKREAVRAIEDAQSDTIQQIKNIDEGVGTDFEINTPKIKTVENVEVAKMSSVKAYDDVDTILNETITSEDTNDVLENIKDYDKSSVQYDIISLPSNGECYKGKIGRLPVAYLTAYDENLITSPNLYRDGLIIDFLIKQKVLKEDFNVDDLCAGDADAITLFLRLTSYGTDFAVSVRDPKTGKEFDYTVDLSTIKYKDFTLKGDENGCFSFTLPLSKDEVKFKFLTRKQLKQLDRLAKLEDKTKVVTALDRNTKEILAALKNDDTLNDVERTEIINYTDKIKSWSEKIENKKNSVAFSRALTNKMELEIQSINGNTDRKFIHDYVVNMRAKDSLEFRKYVSHNEPGVDFTITVERPEEFGGGSFETFLEWDDAIFFNFS